MSVQRQAVLDCFPHGGEFFLNVFKEGNIRKIT